MISSSDIEHVANDVIPLLEKQYNVKIIFLVESGSRMWGFPSDDSDLDCRGVFVPSRDALLGTKRPRDDISYKSEKDGHTYVDLNVWSIQKFGLLLQQSNPSIFEWLQSPIIYYQDEPLMAFAMRAVHSFNRDVLRKHYVSMAIGNYRHKIKNNEKVRVKKYIYVLRALACVCCIDSGYTPHVLYENVIQFLPANLQEKMRQYIHVKTKTEETEITSDSEIEKYMTHFIASNAFKVYTKELMILENEIEEEVVRIMNLGLI